MNLIDLKKIVATISDKVGYITESIGDVVNTFNPKIGTPIIVASEVLKKLGELDDDTAKKAVLGLSETANLLDVIIDEYKKNKELDIQSIEILRDNIKAIDVSLDKFYKIIS